jgi:hypothetical protein
LGQVQKINEYKQTAVDIDGLLTALHNNSFISHEFILTDGKILITLKLILLFIQLFVCLFIRSFIGFLTMTVALIK